MTLFVVHDVTILDDIRVTLSNLSILKQGKAKAIRFSTLELLYKALDCQPGDILEYTSSEFSEDFNEITETSF